MKKFLIASAIASMAGMASAQVGLSGKVSIWHDSTKVGSARDNSMWQEPTNNVAVTATEKVGMGLTARAVIETSLGNNSIDGHGTRLGDRQSTVGLAHQLGTIDLGRNVHSQFLAVTLNDAFGTLYGSVAGDVHNLRGLRMSDGVFVSVKPMDNIVASWDRSQTVGQEATAVGVSATLGPVFGAVARYEQGSEVSTVVGVNGRMGNTTLFYSHSDNKGVATSKGDLVGVRQQMGAFAVKGSYGRTDTDIKAYAVGLDYSLSKRAEVGVAFRSVDYAANSHDAEQVGVGLTYRF